MTIRDEDFGAALTLTEGDDGIWSPPMLAPASEPRDWQSLYEQAHARAEQERARADAAEAHAEELRWAEVAARSDAGAWKSRFKACRQRLSEAEEETKDLRRAAKDVLSLQAEVARLQELLSEARTGSSEIGTIEALRNEVARLHKALTSKARNDATGQLSRENIRLREALERSRGQKDEVVALRGEVSALRKSERAAQTALSKESIRLGKALERTQKQKDTIKALRGEVHSLTRETRQQNRENGRLRRELDWSQGLKTTVRRLSDEAKLLRGELAGYHDQMDIIDARSREAFHLRMALTKSTMQKEALEAKLAERPLLSAAVRGLRQRDKTIESLRTRNERLEEELVKLRSSRAVLSKAAFGSKSERQKKPGTGRKRGQQRGAPGHGRTPRPGLREKKERRNPPKDARICSCCGKPYIANGERSTSLIEIEVKAHIRTIVRPRWRRGCECASSPLEVIAPPVPRLFPGTLYGTSFWARFLFEHCACLRPLSRVAAWYADQGLPLSPGTLANSLKRFVLLFDPLYEAILAHQNQTMVRHADETGWRVQEFRESGRSSRAWLWTSVGKDAVYYIIDPSRSAEVARTLFGDTTCTVFVVCDRYSAYKTLARELAGKVILCWCWSHQRRDFIECAAGQEALTHWCEEWIERIAAIYGLNEERLKHYDPALERQTPAFDAAQRKLRKAVKRLFADAEAELAGLSDKERRAKPLRSLLNHREGLCVFVDKPQVPMDNNAAERALRGPVIGRRLSFGSNSEDGAKFTAIMYSVIGTLSMNGIDVLRWLEAWLKACAKNGGKPPDDLSPWLPWSMSEERRRKFTAPG